jgi:hypothetical protein
MDVFLPECRRLRAPLASMMARKFDGAKGWGFANSINCLGRVFAQQDVTPFTNSPG